MLKLSSQTLHELPSNVLRPSYDRSLLKPGIVHIGLGNFHRAHQSWYLHRLMQMGEAMDWAIIGAGVRPYDKEQRKKLKDQDCLTTLVDLHPNKTSAEVVGSMIDYVPIETGNGSLIKQMANPSICIVALTVTEGGYYIDSVSKEFDDKHPDIMHDAKNPNKPKTAFGAIVAALKIRRDRGIGPFTGQSCDNLQGNGNILRQTIVSLARLSNPELANWINEKCTFPNSMVDCIVPATGPKEISFSKEFGIDDAVPVTHENFRQWVIEDNFCAGRPDWNKVGAIFSDNVHGFEIMKIRILNGGHQIIANAAEVIGITTISDAMANKTIVSFLRNVVSNEIMPHVVPVENMTPVSYLELIEQRFSNPKIVDTIKRVAFDGSSRHTGFIIPSIQDGLNKDMSVSGLALVEAVWARMCDGARENGTIIEANDPFWDELQACAKVTRSNPIAWLEMKNIYGELSNADPFASEFIKWINLIWRDGVEATLQVYLKDTTK